MSWHLQNQVDENAKAGLYKSIYETAVMRALASFADDDGGNCFPSLATLAARSQCSQSTVSRVLKEFRKRRWISVKATGRSNHYRISPHGRVVPAAASSQAHVYTSPDATETIQNSQTDQSECSPRPIRIVSQTNNSYQLHSSKNAHHLDSLSPNGDSGADAPRGEREFLSKNYKDGVTEEEPFGKTLKGRAGAHRNSKGDVPRPCVCGSEHPAGMPTLEEITCEMRKLGLSKYDGDNPAMEAWLSREAEELHDVWLTQGFRMKNGPIRNWQASLRNYHRWRENSL